MIGVADQGYGIKPEDPEKLFAPFERLHNSKNIKGLGLVVCKHLVEAQGGTTWKESLPGEGSTFYFTLPVRKS